VICSHVRPAFTTPWTTRRADAIIAAGLQMLLSRLRSSQLISNSLGAFAAELRVRRVVSLVPRNQLSFITAADGGHAEHHFDVSD